MKNLLAKLSTKVKKELKAEYQLYPRSISDIYEGLRKVNFIHDCPFGCITALNLHCKSVDLLAPYGTILK